MGRAGIGVVVTFPRVLHIEAVGIVDDPGGTHLTSGQQVAAMNVVTGWRSSTGTQRVPGCAPRPSATTGRKAAGWRG